jgi:isoaspartyl peptidase/L-asparaginase-like protein (Ntn-hydrolase superfamily)
MAVFHVEQGLSVKQAAATVMSELRQKTSGEAGLIIVDNQGDVAVQFDTPHMPVSIISMEMDEPYFTMKPSWP